jgi:NAD(P)-dependent dehydrogenase (short-subunit alcohol dehydrogenase family)
MDLGLGGHPEAAEGLVAEAQERLGRVDGSLISVGGPAPGGVLDVAEEHWRAAIDSVLLGPLRLIKALVPHLADGTATASSSPAPSGSRSAGWQSPTACGRDWR